MTCGVVMTAAVPARVMAGLMHGGSLSTIVVMMMDVCGPRHVATRAADPTAANPAPAEAVAVHAVEAMMPVVMMTVSTQSILSRNLRNCVRTLDGVNDARAVGAVHSPGGGRFGGFARCWGCLDAADLHARPQDGNRNRLAQQGSLHVLAPLL